MLVTEWDAFRALDFVRLADVMRGRAMVDLRNVYKPDDVERHGFRYTGIGRAGLIDGAAFREAAE